MPLLRLVLLSGVFALLLGWDGQFASAQPRLDERGFTTAVSERLVDAYSRRFGTPARGRLDAWKLYAMQRRTSPAGETELLVEVNRMLNRIRFVDDQEHWGQADYWATPAESVASN